MASHDSNREEVEKVAAKRLSQTRVRLFMDKRSVFFATLAKRLVPKVDWTIPTAATDGKTLFYNPVFVTLLAPDELLAVQVHEVMHCSQRHPVRRGARDHRLFNIACDLAINQILREAGFKLPKFALFPGEGEFHDMPPNLSSEEYYARLQSRKQQQKPGQGQGKPQPQGKSPGPKGTGGQQPGDPGNGDPEDGKESNGGTPQPGQQGSKGQKQPDPQDDPGGCGQVLDAPGTEADREEASAEWQVAVSQAAQLAKQMGQLPAGLERFVNVTLQPKVTWQDVLAEFVSQTMTARDDYSWSSPNRRYISQGMYLPSLRSDAIGELVVAIDTSGSIDDASLRVFAAELNGILECRPCKVHIVYCDAAINATEEWSPTDGELSITKGVGGGGTSHRPVWQWIDEQGIDPAAVVCLTDGETSFGREPSYPVLWALTPGGSDRVPFGQKIRIV